MTPPHTAAKRAAEAEAERLRLGGDERALGMKEFMGIGFSVTDSVLLPRYK